MNDNRRQCIRYPFSAATEVLNTETAQTQHVISGDLNRFGCFLITPAAFSRGTRVWLQVEYSSEHFSAFGKVAYTSAEGMGIVFSTIEQKDELILDCWLSQKIG